MEVSKKVSYAVVIPSNRVFDSYADKSEFDTYAISVKLLFAQLEDIRIDIIHPLTDITF